MTYQTARMTMPLVALVCLAIGWVFGRWRRGVKENRGEAAVRRYLSKHLQSPHYHLLNNVTLPIQDGTTQIDHILVSRFGIFVLEAKHYTGWIFGSPGAPQWTQVIYRNRYTFQNPIHQNRKHVAAVERLLEFLPPEQFHSVVVFTGDAIFKSERPSGVVSLGELRQLIASFDVEVISENRLQFCVGRLECQRKALTRQTDIEHVAYLNRKFGNVG